MDNFSILLRGMIDPDSKQTIEQQIAQLSQTIKESIKVKITIDTEQFKEISRQIQNIQQYVPQQNILLGMQDTNSTLDKTILKFKILNDGQQKLLSQTIEWTDELGQAVKEAVKFDQETGAPIDRIKELTDNTKKHREEQQKISDIISTQLEKIQSRAKILKKTNWTADFRDLDNFTQSLDPSKISFDNYKKQLNDILLKYNEIASNIRESHNNNLSNLQKEIKLEDQKQSSTMRNWVQTLEADEKLRKIESDRIKQQMQLNSQREKETQQLEQQLALFKQKMLGGDGITGQIDILKDKFSKNIDSTALDNIKQQIESLTTSTPNLNYEMKRLSSNITNIKQAAMQSGNVVTRMFENMVKFLRFYLIGGFVVKIRDSFTEGIKVVKELDTALVELAKVADVPGREIEKFTDQAYEIGTRLGRTGKEVINATAEFVRAGYNLQEAATLGEQALLLTNIGDGIDNVRDASSSLIAILKGFKMEAEDTIHVVDALNEVSNKFAIDTDNLTEILTRVSGTIAQTGTSYEELIGLATAGYESLRNAEKVASGWIYAPYVQKCA